MFVCVCVREREREIGGEEGENETPAIQNQSACVAHDRAGPTVELRIPIELNVSLSNLSMSFPVFLGNA